MMTLGFRPLAGCGLFHNITVRDTAELVSVPLRGVGCFELVLHHLHGDGVSVPLRGVGCFKNYVRLHRS